MVLSFVDGELHILSLIAQVLFFFFSEFSMPHFILLFHFARLVQ